MSKKAAQREQSHESILDSASRLVRERGIAGARVADVMKGAGLTVGGFYAHFASKEALIDETIRRAGAAMRARLFGKLDDKPAEDRAEVVAKRYLSAAHRDAPADGCALPAVVGEVGTRAGEHAEVVAEQIEAMAAELGAHLPAARGGLSRRQLALALVALFVGGLSVARALAGTKLSDEVLAACRALARLATRDG